MSPRAGILQLLLSKSISPTRSPIGIRITHRIKDSYIVLVVKLFISAIFERLSNYKLPCIFQKLVILSAQRYVGVGFQKHKQVL
jgi:hypothetical protein